MSHIARKRADSPLHTKSKEFAVCIVGMTRALNKEWSIAPLFQQILRSGTSIHANIRESEFAQSPSDFIAKLSISTKEANETMGWLEILHESGCMDDAVFIDLSQKCNELIAMLTASIRTARQNQGVVLSS